MSERLGKEMNKETQKKAGAKGSTSVGTRKFSESQSESGLSHSEKTWRECWESSFCEQHSNGRFLLDEKGNYIVKRWKEDSKFVRVSKLFTLRHNLLLHFNLAMFGGAIAALLTAFAFVMLGVGWLSLLASFVCFILAGVTSVALANKWEGPVLSPSKRELDNVSEIQCIGLLFGFGLMAGIAVIYHLVTAV